MKIETYKDIAGEHRFRVRSVNGEILAHGEGYVKRESMMDTVTNLKRNLSLAPVTDVER